MTQLSIKEIKTEGARVVIVLEDAHGQLYETGMYEDRFILTALQISASGKVKKK